MPEGYFASVEDCNDEESDGFDINPDATEIWYDGVDQNCDEANDFDQDGDGVVSSDYGGSDCYDDDDDSTEDCGLYEFSTHTFNSCGVSGQNGPSYSDCLGAYNTENNWHIDESYYSMHTQGIQVWTVPRTGEYQITAQGASGSTNIYAYSASYGAVQRATVELELGQKLLLLVGQVGVSNTTHGNENGGGGGTFVVVDNNYTVTNLTSDLEILIVAGGGGGAPSTSYSSGCTYTTGNAQLTTSGKTVYCQGTSAGGVNGLGGSTSNGGSHFGGAGGGFLTDGGNGSAHCSTPQGGAAFINGGVGGPGGSCYSPQPHGGFGGGGAGGLGAPGGGGGYSGGGAAGNWSSYADYGGGGGSYIISSGSNILSQLATYIGDGSITIEFIE